MIEFWKKWRREILILVSIIALTLFLRLYNLTILPVFGDEAIYIRWAQVMRAEPTLRFLPLSDGKQPLFMWVVIPFLKLVSDPLVAGRYVSALSGIGTLVGIYLLSRLFFKSFRVSLIASLIYAVSPFSVFFDRLALADSMLSMFGVWTLIFAVITVRKIRLDTAMLTGFSLGGAFLTKSPATFFAVLTPLTLILHKWPDKIKEKFNRLSVFVFLFSFTFVIAFGMYNLLRLGPNFHMIELRNRDYVYPLSHLFSSPLDPLKPFLSRSLEYLWMIGPSVLIIMVVFGIIVGLKKSLKEVVLLIAWGFIPIFIVSEFSKIMTARYIYFSLPYIFILAAFSFNLDSDRKVGGAKLNHPALPAGRPTGGLASHLPNLVKPAFILFVIFVVHALVIDFRLLSDPQRANLPRSERSGYLEEWTSGYGIKEVSEYIKEERKNLPAGRQVVVGTEGYFGTLPDGLQIYLNHIPEITVIGVGLSFEEIPNSLIESHNAGNKTYLVVNNTRFMGKADELGLELVASYGKAFRPDGFREALLFYKLGD